MRNLVRWFGTAFVASVMAASLVSGCHGNVTSNRTGGGGGGPTGGGGGGTTGSGGATTGGGGASGKGGTTGSGGATGAGGAGTTGAGGAGGGGTGIGGVTGSGKLAPTSTFYQDISHAAVDPESTTIMNALLAAGWTGATGGTMSLGIDVSFTILTADPSVPRRAFDNGGDDPDCDTAPVPLPPGGNVEGSNDYSCAGDCHLLVYQGTRLYELYQANVTTGQPTGGTFSGGCLVVWDLTHDYWQPAAPPNFSRGDHCNGADAADMPMAPLILTADDVRSGQIKHAFRFTIHNQNIRASVYVHPATHIGGPTGGTDQLPYGARLRLRGDYPISSLTAQGQIVARALQTYGMFLTDGGNLFISATTDVADVMSTGALRGLKATDFEMVDGGTRYNWRDYQCTRTIVSQ